MGRSTHPGSHVCDDVVAEFAALDFGSALHQAGEIVSHALRADGAVKAFDDEIGDFSPAHVAEHHFTAEHDGAGVHAVLVCVFGGGAVRCFEDGVTGDVIDVAA